MLICLALEPVQLKLERTQTIKYRDYNFKYILGFPKQF